MGRGWLGLELFGRGVVGGVVGGETGVGGQAGVGGGGWIKRN